MANVFDQFDAPAASGSGNIFDQFDADPEQARRDQLDAQITAEMQMSPEQWETHIRAEVKAGKPYRAQPGAGGMFSDQVMDPFGLRDEIVGAGQYVRNLVTSGFDTDRAAQGYTDAAEITRAEQRAARKKHGIIPELVGGLGTSGVGRAVAAAPSFVQGAWQSAKAGGGFGAAAGAGHSEGGVAERAIGAGKGAATGAVLAPAISHVAAPAIARTYGGVKDAINYGTQALRSARNPEQAAIDTLADRMVGAGVDPAAARAQISPQPSRQLQGRVNPQTNQPYSPADMADIISRSARGDSHAAIAQDYGLNPSTVSNYVRTYRENNPTPLNLIDIAKEVAGDGGAGPVTRLGRAAHSLAGDESGEAAQRLLSRQETQPGRVSNVIQRSVAGGDFEATRAAGLQNLRNEADTAYRQFYSEPDLLIDDLADLVQDPLFRAATVQAQQQARVATIRRNQIGEREAQAAGRPFTPEPVPTVDAEAEIFSPELLDKIQRQLRITSEGFANNPNAAAHARDLREVFLDRIEGHYPTFRGIRQNYARGMGEFGEEGALEAGAGLVSRLGAPAREALRGFGDMTPAQQELFRLGFARKLMDDAANVQIGGAVANKFNTTAVREIIETLYPRANAQLWQQGQRLIRDLQREATTTRTARDVLSGSRTAELGSDMGHMMEGAKAAADVATGRWGNLLENLSTRLSTQLGQRGAREVLRILTETDPAALLPILNRLEQAAQRSAQRQQLVSQARQLRAETLPAVGGQAGLISGRELAPVRSGN